MIVNSLFETGQVDGRKFELGRLVAVTVFVHTGQFGAGDGQEVFDGEIVAVAVDENHAMAARDGAVMLFVDVAVLELPFVGVSNFDSPIRFLVGFGFGVHPKTVLKVIMAGS